MSVWLWRKIQELSRKKMTEQTIDSISNNIRNLANRPVFIDNISRFDLK